MKNTKSKHRKLVFKKTTVEILNPNQMKRLKGGGGPPIDGDGGGLSGNITCPQHTMHQTAHD